MQISSNLKLNSVDGTAPQNRSKPTPAGDSDGDQDRVTLTDLSSVQGALENAPGSRPDLVASARLKIADPTYPNQAITSQISQFLADKMLAQNN
jgi:hypothetical protein